MSKKRTWWALYWPNKKKLGIWKAFQKQHEMCLYPTKKAAMDACRWYSPPNGPVPRRVTINVYGEK